LKLLFTYIARKLTDQDPWVGLKVIGPPKPLPQVMKKSWNKVRKFFRKLKKRIFPDKVVPVVNDQTHNETKE
jgi:hypothetical protein